MSDTLRAALLIVMSIFWISCGKPSGSSNLPFKPPTYAEHIAPILYQHCVECHRPGEAAPFELLTYEDAYKRARQIVEVTASRYMPPWRPVDGHGSFEGERRLSDEELVLLDRWHRSGAALGDKEAVPDPPEFTEGWQLGEPDLVVKLEESFTVPAEGTDVYRNFVLPTNLPSARYVKGVEFRPGNRRAVHHAFVLIDDEGSSRRLDAADDGIGYDGMTAGESATSPPGHFASWQPGRRASFVPSGMSWRISANTDLVLQLHMQTIGREQKVRPSVGLYFTEEPPKRIPYKLSLVADELDIPAGEKEYRVRKAYTLPVPVKVMAVLPHAHYLAKKIQAFADLPDGSRQWILRIDDWDFNWQADYRLSIPLDLPAGSRIVQQFSYDNSADNPSNPNDPPQRVIWGQRTVDEMGELWLQLLTQSAEDRAKLNRDYGTYAAVHRLRSLEKRAAAGEDSYLFRLELAKAALASRDLNKAVGHAQAASLFDDAAAEPYYMMGMIKVSRGERDASQPDFEAALAADPSHHGALNSLGMLALGKKNLSIAQEYFERAVASDSESAASQGNLGMVYFRLGNPRLAKPSVLKAVELAPENGKWRRLLDEVNVALAGK